MNDKTNKQATTTNDVDQAKLAERRARNEADLREKWNQSPAQEWKHETLDAHKKLAAAYAGGQEKPPTDPHYRNPHDGGTYIRETDGSLTPAKLNEKGEAVALNHDELVAAGYEPPASDRTLAATSTPKKAAPVAPPAAGANLNPKE